MKSSNRNIQSYILLRKRLTILPMLLHFIDIISIFDCAVDCAILVVLLSVSPCVVVCENSIPRQCYVIGFRMKNECSSVIWNIRMQCVLALRYEYVFSLFSVPFTNCIKQSSDFNVQSQQVNWQAAIMQFVTNKVRQPQVGPI